MAHNSTKKRMFPAIPSAKALHLPSDLKAQCMERHKADIERMRYNIKYVTWHMGYSLTDVIRKAKSEGVSFNRVAIVMGSKKDNVKLLYISSWALILGVPTWLMLSDNIEADCERLGIRRI